MESNPSARTAVDFRKMAGEDRREEIAAQNALGGKPSSWGGIVLLLIREQRVEPSRSHSPNRLVPAADQ